MPDVVLGAVGPQLARMGRLLVGHPAAGRHIPQVEGDGPQAQV